MSRDTFIFYRSFYEACSPLDKNDKASLMDAICLYALDGLEVDLSPIAKGMFSLIKPQLEANRKRYENGSKSKQNGSKTEAKPKQDESEPEANKNKNKNENKNDNVNGELDEQYAAIKQMALSIRTEWFDEDKVLALWKRGTYRAWVGKILEVMPAYAKEKGWDKCEARFLKNFSDVLKDGAWKNYEPKKEKYDGPWM